MEDALVLHIVIHKERNEAFKGQDSEQERIILKLKDQSKRQNHFMPYRKIKKEKSELRMRSLDAGVHDWNNAIHFFSKKGWMQDAENAYKRMRSLGHAPNAQTFRSMVTGYAAMGSKYTEVTELWGEMKSIAAATSLLRFDQELLDSVLYTFVRGGFFSRANEVVEMMEKKNMFVDKYKYRMLFLKHHKTAFKGKCPKVHSESHDSHHRKREAGLAFKNWLGLS